jgi:hypothetical protein
MSRLLAVLTALVVGCIVLAPLSPAHGGYAPVVVYEVVLPPPPPIVYEVVLPPPSVVYLPYPYGYWGPPHTWYGRPWPSYSRHYHHRRYARFKKKKRSAGNAADTNWYYCRSYWRYPKYMGEGPTTRKVAGRFWWPYYNPRPDEKDPCDYKNNKITVKTPPPPYRAY